MKSLVSLVKKIIFKPEPFILTEEHKDVLSSLEDSDANIFLTGKAGTGKSTLIRYFRHTTKKKVVVLAPTGLAALNIGGQTVHSFFRLPPRMIQKKDIRRLKESGVYRNVDTIIIDEASMLRADMLDVIDAFLRIHGRDSRLPFGGIQMVLVGDMFQLPPVVTRDELPAFNELYETPYFFSAASFSEGAFMLIEFDTVFRQKQVEFITVLNQIRTGKVSMSDLTKVNLQVRKDVTSEKHLILCPTNEAVNRINQTKLGLIDSPAFTFNAVIEGIFPTEERSLPVETELVLKKGARVLFLKNDPAGRWVNGTLGTVTKLKEDEIRVELDESGETVIVSTEVWENIRYEYNEETGDIDTKVIGKLTQYPLRLAWAITIHKSQGMSFDTVVIDFRHAPFAHGQTYVALSRARTLEGLLLTRAIYPNDVIVDERIVEFQKKVRRG